jgi:putative ABC transport system permease protein
MLTNTLRGMLAHKLRLALTTASVALGIAFLAGTLMLTDTMKLAFDQLFGKVNAGTDAVVRQEAAYVESSGIGTARSPIPASVLESVRSVDGVRAAEGAVSGYALLTDNEGKAVLSSGGAPTQGYSLPDDEKLRGDVNLRSGRAPEGPGEVAIDARSAESAGIALGSDIRILFRNSSDSFTVVGTVGFGGEKDLGGTTSAYFDSATAQQVLGTPGHFDSISVSADEGVSQEELAERLAAVVPDGAEAVTGATVAQEASDSVAENLKFVGILFMVFAGVALFVGSFIIWNTFSMIVTQRTREIALLRAVGATRKQILRNLIGEALLIGLGASAIGVGLGIAVAKGLNALMGALGFSLPTTSLQISSGTVYVSLVVGTLVTVVAALVPARRATKVLPVEALREATPGAYAPSRTRAAAGFVLLGGGVAALLAGLYGGAGMALFGLGVLGVVSGVMTLAPLAARPLAALIGAPLRMRGVPGDLATQNAMRNPRRTASTAAALMIGLTLVVSMGVFASSLKASFGDILGESTRADLYVTGTSMQSEGFSPEVTRVVADVPGVRTVSGMGWGQARVAGETAAFSSVDPATIEQVLDLDVSAGSLQELGMDAVAVSRSAATAHGWDLGDAVPVEFPTTGAHELRVGAIFDGEGGFIDTDYLVTLAAHDAATSGRLESAALVLVDEGADVAAVQDRVADVLVAHPDAKVLDRKEYTEEAGGFVNQLLTFVTVMLLLAVIIALLGIVNTLALSVFERKRELGLLRAVGMTRSQVRAMVRWESVVISLIGAATGAVLGTGLGLALAQALKDDGISAISVPVLQVVVYVVLAVAAGVLAAVGPARSASKVDVLKAVVAS